jgi:hypothetical protein
LQLSCGSQCFQNVDFEGKSERFHTRCQTRSTQSSRSAILRAQHLGALGVQHSKFSIGATRDPLTRSDHLFMHSLVLVLRCRIRQHIAVKLRLSWCASVWGGACGTQHTPLMGEGGLQAWPTTGRMGDLWGPRKNSMPKVPGECSRIDFTCLFVSHNICFLARSTPHWVSTG